MTTTVTSIAPPRPTTVARPLKVLIPLIQEDLRQANEVGMEYYRGAGDKLREARAQVATHRWGAWLSQNFALTRRTAWNYMRLSELFEQDRNLGSQSLNEILGRTAQRRKQRTATRPMRAAVAAVDVDYLSQERETREEEMRRHRALALQLIDIGYKALATRLHPDRAGGTHEGMRRLNRVRDELKSVAKTRRFD
jgi:hypothetical protein